MHYFSSFIVVFIIGVFAFKVDGVLGKSLSTKEKEEMMHKVHNSCVNTTGVDEETIQKASRGEFDDINPIFKCYAKCVMVEIGAMHLNGTLDYSACSVYIRDDLKDPVKKMLENCSHFTDEDLCQRAYNIFKCAHNYDPEHFFII